MNCLINLLSLLLVLGCVLYSLQDEDPDYAKSLRITQIKCAKESKASMGMLMKAWKTKIFPNNDQMKEFSKCFLEKLNIVNANNEINVEEMKKVLKHFIKGDDKVNEVLEHCKSVKGDDEKDTALKVTACCTGGKIE